MTKKTTLRKSWFVLTAIICLFLALTSVKAEAQTTKYWIGGDGYWSDATKWSGGTAPASGDKAVLNTNGNVIYNLNLSLSGLEITPTGTVIMGLSHGAGVLALSGTNSLIVNGTGYDECDADGNCITYSYARYVLYNDANLTTTGNSIIATDNTGEFYHVSGTKTVGQDLIVGRDSGSYGYYQMEGGILNVAGNTILGQTGWGHFYQDAGTHNVGKDLILANTANLANEESVGYYEMWGGALNVTGNSIIGAAGYSGWFDQYDGTHTVSTNLILGRDAESWGRYELSAGTLTVQGNSSIIGQSGEGQFAQTGGTYTITNYLYLGSNVTGVGIYELTGTGAVSANTELIGFYGTGTFTQSGGTNNVNKALYLGYYSGSNGTFRQTGGTSTVTNNLILGALFGSAGTYELSDTGMLSAGNEHIGYYGTGTFKQSGGVNTVANNLYLAYLSNSTGTYELSGTGSLTANIEYIGYNGTGTFIQTGGTNTVASSITISNTPGISFGIYNLSGGILTATSIFNNNQFNYSGGTLNANIANNDSGTFNLSGAGTRVANGNVTNYGVVKATDTTVTFTGTFNNYGAYISDPSSNYFNNLFIGTTGYLVGGEGDLFSISEDFLNYSASALWNTEAADLAFADNAIHSFYLGDAGQTFFWDDLMLFGIMNITGDAYYYADELLGLGLASFTFTGNGRIYFDALNANNAYLLSYTYGYNYLAASYDAVPEPATFILLLLGVFTLNGIKSKLRFHA